MDKNARIYVAGHRGLVGSAIVRVLQRQGYKNLIMRTHAELDLLDQQSTRLFFETEKPQFVVLAAAKVGGIHANNTYPAEFIQQNLVIQNNVIHEAWRSGVKRLLFLGSSCIYPRDCPQPIKEEYLLSGPLEFTNRSYALAKIAGVEMCWAYNRQYGTQYLAVMPTNLYGPGDNYHSENSHVLPALIRRFHEAKIQSAEEVVVWGTGNPKREFLYSDDLAEACCKLMNFPDQQFASLFAEWAPPLINIGTGQDITVRDLAFLIKEIVGFEGSVKFDLTKSDGTPRKLLDISRIQNLGWGLSHPLREGLQKTYAIFCAEYSTHNTRQ